MSDRFGNSGRRGQGFDVDEEVHYPTRPVDKDKAEQELVVNIKKATSPEETAPKQKHVRNFKALITVHKVLQEGHPITIKEAHGQTAWLETCARTLGSDGQRGYAPLIRTYVHRLRPEFNGLFEYEEYVTLKGIDDPNEGYETISDLMGLQDQIESFQKMVFSHFSHTSNNECRISALVPLVKESWGIYRFITSMMRAMFRRTNDADALEPLRQRYTSQHYSLRKFYYECSNLKYLTGLINVPKLAQEPPNLLDTGDAPDLPPRPKTAASPPPAPSPDAATVNEQARMLREYEDQQAALAASRETEERRRLEQEAHQAREFEEMQRRQAEAQRLAQEQLVQQQQQQQYNMQASQQAELERELLALRGQWERDQMFLERYDRRVRALEAELGAVNANVNSQMTSKDDLIKQLQDQVTLWRNKYEALAKLYSQLRTEHLDMLSKFKAMQLKANSAQEAVDRMERMERDLKSKNLELADMLRERDRARLTSTDEIDRLRRDLNFANERAEDASHSKNSEVSSVLNKYNRQIQELEDSLRAKQIQIDDLLFKVNNAEGDLERLREEKDQEILVLDESMTDTIQRLQEAQQALKDLGGANDTEIDTLILDNQKKLNQIIDSILQACMQKVEDAIYELESPTQAGNTNATPEYTLSMIEKAVNNANEFATVYHLYLGGEKGGEHVEVIKAANEFAQTLSEVLINTKGITRLAKDDDASDKIINVAKTAGDVGTRLFFNLQSFNLSGMQVDRKREAAMRNGAEARGALTKLSDVVDGLVPKGTKAGLDRANGDIGDIVEQEMSSAARAIELATQRLQELMSRPRDSSRFSAVDLQVHDSILAAAMAITSAIARLIKAATDSQQEIVKEGRGSSSSQQFYKRNNRWTEGLISAAKSVAFSTNLLIESADGVLSGTHSLEQLIVASNEVAAATAQLVAASRVKASLMSKTQERLELAAKAVTRRVKAVSAKQSQEDEPNWKNMELEKELGAARHRLGAMRRAGYHTNETD
ncbi:hypothetical protein B0H13DRAFT_2229558 [Mycena leptocephala]|nr:hypothetical protein B0H13DRAFT_2229558 [Mycena leptocephala]